MLLLALRVFLEFHLKMVNLGVKDTINWTTVENEVASSFGARRGHVAELRQQFLVSGEVLVRERSVVVAPEPAADEIPVMNYRAKLLPHHLLSLCQWVDRQHSEGRTVTNSKAQNFIRITFEIEITQRSVPWFEWNHGHTHR
jgi:hypothetical protein